jgi:hypothetical protein
MLHRLPETKVDTQGKRRNQLRQAHLRPVARPRIHHCAHDTRDTREEQINAMTMTCKSAGLAGAQSQRSKLVLVTSCDQACSPYATRSGKARVTAAARLETSSLA